MQSQDIHPFRILAILLSVGAVFALILFMSPGKISLGDDFFVKIPRAQDVFSKELLPKEWVVEEALADAAPLLDAQKQKLDEMKADASSFQGDSLDRSYDTTKVIEVAKVLSYNENPHQVPIEFPEGDPRVMERFFRSLDIVSTRDTLVRIFHYGDSQLEGDRMTERLRQRLQGQFGGLGVGLVPITDIKNIRSTLVQSASGDWKKFSAFESGVSRLPNGHYGMFASQYRTNGGGTLSFVKSSYHKQASLNRFDRMKVYLRNPEGTVKLRYSMGGRQDSLLVQPSAQPKGVLLPLQGELGKVDLRVKTNAAAEFYGVSFDGHRGVAVDNMPMRGSSGVEFTKIDPAHLGVMVRQMNVRLLILQFGVNVVPMVRDDYSFYEKLFYRQLRHLKEAAPEVDILVVGVSDMARRQGTELASYPNIALIRQAQKRAAFNAGCAYWDLFAAMGGPNSIVHWAEKKPAWANKDYTHFTRQGANHVGDLLYNELMKAYDQHRQRRLSMQGLSVR